MTMLGELTLDDAANEAAGNWKKFDSFVWFRNSEIEQPEDWGIHYTHHRDSGLLDQSNAAYFRKELIKFTEGDDPDVAFESHNHWAVGYIEGFSIRAYRDGQITDAFKAFHEIKAALAAYPILDDADYSHREYEATIENIKISGWRICQDYDLPEDWQYEVYDWLANNSERSIENVDDQGGWPDESEIEMAIEALEYVRVQESP